MGSISAGKTFKQSCGRKSQNMFFTKQYWAVHFWIMVLAASIRRNYLYAPILIWFWIVIEMINGLGHPFWALYEGGYVPGLVTAPILLMQAVYLSRQLLRNDSRL